VKTSSIVDIIGVFSSMKIIVVRHIDKKCVILSLFSLKYRT